MNETSILQSLGIEKLNDMQEEMCRTAVSASHVILLSPTGTGKTLAYLLPLLQFIDTSSDALQAVVVVPTRELAQQSEDVLRRSQAGVRSTCLYGGRPAMTEHRTLKELRPHVVFATPGRMNDHLDKDNLDGTGVRLLVIDEFDKCVELGFQEEMTRLVERMPRIARCWLTSATDAEEIPTFIQRIGQAAASWQRIDHLEAASEVNHRMQLYAVKSPEKDKLQTLGLLLSQIGGEPAIVFVAHRESADRIGSWLKGEGFFSETYHGGMEQDQRERALYKFRSGSANVLVSTDLAARGLDIPEVRAVIHYHLPLKAEDFTHRNGRTARWNAEGCIYLIVGPTEQLPDFADEAETMELTAGRIVVRKPRYVSVYIGRGKRDKLSKSDVLGFLCKKGGAKASEIGRIDVGPHHAYAALLRSRAKEVLSRVANEKIKGMKTLIEEMRK